MKVEIMSKKMVKPSCSTTDRPERLKITCLDQLQFPGYLSLLFFFKGTGEGREGVLSEGVCNLEESLSEALTLFYPLAGRYVDDDLSIRCEDEGVHFIVAVVDDRIDQILRVRPSPEERLQALVTFRQNVAGNVPLVTIRVNVFECGGLAIGISFSHLVADICSISMFIRSWAALSRMGNQDAIATVLPDFTSSARFPAIKLSGKGLVPLLRVEENFVSDRFSFPLECLRTKFGESRVVLASAIICKALLNSVDRGRRYVSPSRSLMIFHAMNLRGRAGPPLAQDYFGNMSAIAAIKLMLEGRKDAELEGMAKLIGGGLRSARERYSDAESDGELCSMMTDIMRQSAPVFTEKKECLMAFSSWCGFGLHENDFGWGPPELLWTPGSASRLTFLMDRSDGGIDALVTLSPNDMILFKQDPDISGLSIF